MVLWKGGTLSKLYEGGRERGREGREGKGDGGRRQERGLRRRENGTGDTVTNITKRRGSPRC
jgi:hypothetical protein